MFSNITEYDCFAESFCKRCTKYSKSSFLEKSSCLIEYKVHVSFITDDENKFPCNDLKAIKNICRYACKSFKTSDEELMKAYRKILEE